MNKILGFAIAGAMVFSMVPAVYAGGSIAPYKVVNSNFGNTTVVTSTASSNTGQNGQVGGGFQVMTTGNTFSKSNVFSVANQNAAGYSFFGSTSQSNMFGTTAVDSSAGSNSGSNTQNGFGFSGKIMHTGSSGAVSSVSSWAGINLQGVTVTP